MDLYTTKADAYRSLALLTEKDRAEVIDDELARHQALANPFMREHVVNLERDVENLIKANHDLKADHARMLKQVEPLLDTLVRARKIIQHINRNAKWRERMYDNVLLDMVDSLEQSIGD